MELLTCFGVDFDQDGRLPPHMGGSALKELIKRKAYNCWERLIGGGSPGASSFGSKQQYNTPVIVNNIGNVERPGPSSSNTEKQCEVPLADESTGNVESPRAASSDTKKQSDTHSIDKSKGDAESPGASSSDNKKQCHASAIGKSKKDVESPGTSSSGEAMRRHLFKRRKSGGMTESSTEMQKHNATNPLQISTIDVNTTGRCV